MPYRDDKGQRGTDERGAWPARRARRPGYVIESPRGDIQGAHITADSRREFKRSVWAGGRQRFRLLLRPAIADSDTGCHQQVPAHPAKFNDCRDNDGCQRLFARTFGNIGLSCLGATTDATVRIVQLGIAIQFANVVEIGRWCQSEGLCQNVNTFFCPQFSSHSLFLDAPTSNFAGTRSDRWRLSMSCNSNKFLTTSRCLYAIAIRIRTILS